MPRKKRDTDKMTIKVPVDNAMDWRGVVEALRALGAKNISLQSFIIDSVNSVVEDHADSGLCWRAIPAGKLTKGFGVKPRTKEVRAKETTNG